MMNNSVSNNKIKNGALLSYVASGLNIIIGLLFTPWLVKSLGTSDYGLYALASTFVSYFLIDFGLGNVVSKYVSQYRVLNSDEDISQFLSVVTKTFVIITIILAFIFSIVYLEIDTIFKGLSTLEIERFKVIYIISASYNLISFPFNLLNGILNAYEYFGKIQIANIIQKLSLVLLMSVALILDYGVFALVVIQAISGFLAIVYKLSYVLRLKISVDWTYSNFARIKDILRFSIWVCLLGLSNQFIYGGQTMILGVTSNTYNISNFNIAYTFYGFVYIFANGLNGLFLPKVSFLNKKEDSISKINNLLIKVGRIQLMIIGLIISGFAIIGKEFIYLWMGEDYKLSYWITLCLLIPTLITLTEEIAATLLYVREKIRYKTFLYLLATIASGTLTVLLSNKLGAIGAGLSVLLCISVFDIFLLNIIYRKKMNIAILQFFKECHLRYLLPLSITFVICYAAKYYVIINNWFDIAIVVLGYSVVYAISMWFLYMNETEKEYIKSNLTNKLKWI